MNINEYTNSLIESKRESIEEATVEELKKAAALHAAKTQNVEKGLSKVASIANRIKSKVNKESTEGGSGVGKKIATGAGVAGAALAGAGIVAKKIADKKKEKEQENVAESVLYLFESAILDTRSKLPEDKDKLRKLFIQTAKSNRFKEKDYNVWGNPGYNDEKENQSQLNKFKNYKLGYCFRDDGDNYICYNFESDTFHFFDHEESGCDNMSRKAWSLEKIISYINE